MTKRVVLIAVPLFLVAAGVIWWIASRDEPDSRLWTSGTVEATEADVGFTAGGRLETLSVREGQSLGPGEGIAFLDRAQTQAERRQAEAELAAVRAQLLELETGSLPEEVAQTRASLRAARARLAKARRDHETTRRLYRSGTVTRADLDKDKLAQETAEADATRAREQHDLAEKGPRKERIEAQRARVAQAEARLAAIDAALAQMAINAPFGGVVTVTHREPGEIVPPGTAVVTIMDPDDRWVRTYVPENRIGAVKLGAQAVIRSDTYPGREYAGEVSFISPEAEFTPKNVQTAEERVKLVYAVKVRILEDAGQELKPGMPTDVAITTEPAGEPLAGREAR